MEVLHHLFLPLISALKNQTLMTLTLQRVRYLLSKKYLLGDLLDPIRARAKTPYYMASQSGSRNKANIADPITHNHPPLPKTVKEALASPKTP
jgi:hypothetical protein